MKERAAYLIILLLTVLILAGSVGGNVQESFMGINKALIKQYSAAQNAAGCAELGVGASDEERQACCDLGFCDASTTMFGAGSDEEDATVDWTDGDQLRASQWFTGLDGNQKKAVKLCPALAEGITKKPSMDILGGIKRASQVKRICGEMSDESSKCYGAARLVPELQNFIAYACGKETISPQEERDMLQRLAQENTPSSGVARSVAGKSRAAKIRAGKGRYYDVGGDDWQESETETSSGGGYSNGASYDYYATESTNTMPLYGKSESKGYDEYAVEWGNPAQERGVTSQQAIDALNAEARRQGWHPPHLKKNGQQAIDALNAEARRQGWHPPHLRPGYSAEDERTQSPCTYPGRTGGGYCGNPGGWSGQSETRCKQSGQPGSCSTYAPYGESNAKRGSKCEYCADMGCSKCSGQKGGRVYENYENNDRSAYILKSEIVPPVCPACPAIPSKESCQPCPPCARCPEPSFECKKVPNYKGGNLPAIPGVGPWGGAGAGGAIGGEAGGDPMPRLNSFSGFS